MNRKRAFLPGSRSDRKVQRMLRRGDSDEREGTPLPNAASPSRGFRIRYALPLVPVGVLVVALWVGYSASVNNWESAQRALQAAEKASNAALELKFLSADFNGWQTAYALDFARRSPPTAPLIGRLEFVDSTRKFSLQMKVLESHLATPEERQTMLQLETTFRAFMSADEQIFAAYESGDPARIRAAHDEVLKAEVERFQEIARNTDHLVNRIRDRTLSSLNKHHQTATMIRRELWSTGALGLVFCAALTLLLIKSMRKTDALVAELSKQALADALTGLPNRRSWDQRICSELSRADRLHYPIAVVALDFDYFKKFNDAHGHLEGDNLLRLAANAWSHALRESDLLARIGGEEFALLLPGCSAAEAGRLVERIRPITPLGQTFSAGIAVRVGGETSTALFSRADAALYQAKLLGRNRTVIAPESPKADTESE